MIDRTFLTSLGLSKTQIGEVLKAAEAELMLLALLCKEKIPPDIALKIVRITPLSDMDVEHPELMKLKIQSTWEDFIVK
jgi:hypothetical protein